VVEIIELETAPEFDDSDALAGSIACWKIVNFCNFIRIMRSGCRMRLESHSLRQPPEMRFSLRAIVEAKNSSNDFGVLAGHANGPYSTAVIAFRMAVFLQLNVEGL